MSDDEVNSSVPFVYAQAIQSPSAAASYHTSYGSLIGVVISQDHDHEEDPVAVLIKDGNNNRHHHHADHMKKKPTISFLCLLQRNGMATARPISS